MTSPYPAAVHPDLGAPFTFIVETARTFTPERADHLQKVYEAHWSPRVDSAGRRVHKALVKADLTANYDRDDRKAWIYLDELCGIVGGASDVAEAVLARDWYLISRRDFNTLTGWWVAAGLDLPVAPNPEFAPYITPRGFWYRLARHLRTV